MDLIETLSTRVTNREKQYGIKPSRLRGQHFLVDERCVQKILKAAELEPNDTVLEIGPGLGVLTSALLLKVKRLIAVELDPLFVRVLKDEFGGQKHLQIIEADIMRMRLADIVSKDKLQNSKYKVVTNLPYNITSTFFKKFLFEPPHPSSITVMVQEEVARRITKPIGSMGMLGMMCNLYARTEFISRVPSSAFAPPPRVSSAIVKLDLYDEAAFKTQWGIEHGEAEDLLSFAANFFREPRKKMCGVYGRWQSRSGRLAAVKCREALLEIGESQDSRPAVLSMEKWVQLWRLLR